MLSERSAAVGEVINVGNDEEITMAALAQQVKAQAQSASEIILVPYDVAYTSGFEDMQRRVPDLSKLSRVMGDRPRTNLKQILDAVIRYARSPERAAAAHASGASAAQQSPPNVA